MVNDYKKCPNCQALNYSDRAFCFNCKHPLLSNLSTVPTANQQEIVTDASNQAKLRKQLMFLSSINIFSIIYNVIGYYAIFEIVILVLQGFEGRSDIFSSSDKLIQTIFLYITLISFNLLILIMTFGLWCHRKWAHRLSTNLIIINLISDFVFAIPVLIFSLQTLAFMKPILLFFPFVFIILNVFIHCRFLILLSKREIRQLFN